MAPRARKEYTIQRMADDVAAVVKHVWRAPSTTSSAMLEDAAHMTIFSHPTRIAEAVDELWGGALRYEEEL